MSDASGTSETAGGEAPRPRSILSLLPALGLALVVFARTVTFPFVNWDDPSHFRDNPLAVAPLARGLGGLFWTEEIGYPAPVLQLSFALDHALFGWRAGLWHAENVALHLLDVALLHKLARRLGLSLREAGAVAALFAVHPLVVEPVSWVTGRKDVLSMAMLLGACLVATSDRLRPIVKLGVANLLAVLAVLVVPRMVVGAPFVAIVVMATQPRRPRLAAAAAMAPALALALAVVLAGVTQVKRLGAVPKRAATDVVADVAGALGLQLSHLVLPVDLLAYYLRVPGDPPLATMVAAPCVVLAAVWLAWTYTPRGSPERTGLLLAGLAYAPVSCVFAILRWTCDSYMYLPLAALSLAVVPAVARAWPERLERFGRHASASLFLVLALWSFAYGTRWSSSTSVWAGSVARYPTEPLAWEHEALGLLADGRVAEADRLFIEIAVRFPAWQDTLDDSVRAYERAGRPDEAWAVLVRGVRAGAPACLRIFWMRVIGGQVERRVDRELLAVAFDKGEDAMKEGLHDPDAFARVAAVLRAAGLEPEAARVDEHVRRALR